MTASTLYRWPPAARFDRVVPKNKFYEHGNVGAAVRDSFVADVQRITWAYKLADVTIHLRGNHAVPEIQVFAIDAKGDDVSDTVLSAIDTAVQFPIVFEVSRGEGAHARTRMVAAHKAFGASKSRLSTYFTTDWLPPDAPRSPLPRALDLPGLYAALLAPLLPCAVSSAECITDVMARIDQARKIEREIATLERRLRTEPQLNRKVELRRQLRDRIAGLTALTNPTAAKAEDDLGRGAPWTR